MGDALNSRQPPIQFSAREPKAGNTLYLPPGIQRLALSGVTSRWYRDARFPRHPMQPGPKRVRVQTSEIKY